MKDYRLHQRLGYRVSRLSHLLQSSLEAILAKHALTRLMWCVLIGVGEEGVTTPSELAHYVGVTRPAISRLLRELQKKGLLARVSGQGADGRSVEVELTNAGRAVIQSIRPLVDEHHAYFAGKLEASEYQALTLALQRLLDGERQALDHF